MTKASPSKRFAQKNVLVTGAAVGLGRHIAQAFAAEGADIAILDFQDTSATVREVTAKIEGKTVADARREWEATPMNRFVEPHEVASVMLFLCSADASAMTGQAVNVTGGLIMR